MNNLPISSKYVSTPDKPVDEGEREAVVARINAAFEEGRFDDVDYRSMLDVAFSAKTLGELRPVVERLPAVASYETPGNIESATVQPGEVSQARQPASGTVLIVTAVTAILVVILGVLLATLFL